MFFVVETEKNVIVKNFFEKTKKRMLIDRYGVRKMDVALTEENNRYRMFVMVKPLLSNTMIYGAAFVLIPAVLFGWGWTGYLVPAIFVSLKFFETNYFGYMLLRYALDKEGYKGDYIRIPLTQIVEEAIINESA